MRCIKEILKAWANVTVSKRIGIEYPYKSSAFLCKSESNYKAMLNEDECKYVDDAMYLLSKANEKWYLLIKGYYVESKSYVKLSHIICASDKSAKAEIEKAETYIFAKIDDKIHDLSA